MFEPRLIFNLLLKFLKFGLRMKKSQFRMLSIQSLEKKTFRLNSVEHIKLKKYLYIIQINCDSYHYSLNVL